MSNPTDPEISSQDRQSTKPSPALTLDTTFELLANRYRRLTLYLLTDATNGILTQETIFEEVTTLWAALTESAITWDRYQEIATNLYRWHLPVLADVGVIDWDRRHGTIRYFPHQRLNRWVHRARREEFAD